MKKFITRLVIFVLPVLGGAMVIDHFITIGIKKKSALFTRVWYDVLEGKLNSDLLIYGSSRAVDHIDPAVLDDTLHLNAYNLGMSGHNILMVNARHNMVMKHNRKPKAIILSVDVFTLDKRKDLLGKESLAPFLFSDADVREISKQYEGFTVADYYLPLVRYVGSPKTIQTGLRYLWDKKEVSKSQLLVRGYTPHKAAWTGEFDSMKKAMRVFPTHIDTPSIKVFDDLLADCLRKGIKVVMVYTPEYYECKDFLQNREGLIQLFREHAAKFNVPFLDYSRDPICYEKKYFFNALHLNYDGGVIFTAKFAHDIKEMGLLN